MPCVFPLSFVARFINCQQHVRSKRMFFLCGVFRCPSLPVLTTTFAYVRKGEFLRRKRNKKSGKFYSNGVVVVMRLAAMGHIGHSEPAAMYDFLSTCVHIFTFSRPSSKEVDTFFRNFLVTEQTLDREEISFLQRFIQLHGSIRFPHFALRTNLYSQSRSATCNI
jgi:hypothetical protein